MRTIQAHEFAEAGNPIELSDMNTAGEATESLDLILPIDSRSVYEKIAFQSTVLLSTSTNVKLRVEGNIDNDINNWVNLNDAGEDTEVSSDGTYLLVYNGDGNIRYTRLKFVSESGGTGATIKTKARVR